MWQLSGNLKNLASSYQNFRRKRYYCQDDLRFTKKKKMRLRQDFITAYQTWKLCLRPFAIGISQFSCSILLTSRFLSHFWLWPALLATVSAFASQQTFTCSKSTIEKLEKGEKHVQSKQKRHQNDAIALMLKPSKHISFQNLWNIEINVQSFNIFHTFC